VVPASGGGTTNFLRADGVFAAPPGGGGGDNLTVNGVAVADGDLDDATPSAPADGVNVRWQQDGGSPANISANVPDATAGTRGVIRLNGDLTGTADTPVFRNMAARSVLGFPGAGGGPPSDITAGTNDHVLRRSSGTVGFGTLATASLDDNAVTYAKQQDVSAASRLLGRGSAAGAGDPEEITLGANLTMAGTVLSASGGGGGTATTVEVNLGSALAWRGRFTITDAAITPTSKVLVWQAPGPYTGKGSRSDAHEGEAVQVIGVIPAAGSAQVAWQTPPVYANKPVLPESPKTTTIPTSSEDLVLQRQIVPTRINLVRGNVKFSYVVFS
jgi:hypothetical protein